jgi:hypothetical protein
MGAILKIQVKAPCNRMEDFHSRIVCFYHHPGAARPPPIQSSDISQTPIFKAYMCQAHFAEFLTIVETNGNARIV